MPKAAVFTVEVVDNNVISKNNHLSCRKLCFIEFPIVRHPVKKIYLTNVLYNAILSDVETCYKVFRADLIKAIPLRSNRFEIEPEITAKVLKRGHRIYEVPISYTGREYTEGKKIGLKDAFEAVWALLKYRFVD